MASSISMDGEGTASEGRVDKKSGNAASSNTLFNNTNTTESVQVPMVYDTMTFESRQAVGLRDMEKRIEADMKRKRKSWEKEVERMRQEFLHLYPTDRVWGSEELLNDPLVAKRRGSTDILDPKKMKTLFLDYPDVGRKFRIRFDVSGFDPTSIHVASDGDRIIVRAIKHESATNLTNMSNDVNDQQNNNSENNANNSDESYSNAIPSSTSSSTIQLQNQSNDTAPRSSTDTTNMNNTSAPPKRSINRAYERKIQKPKEVDPHKFKSYLTSDHILIVEAPLRGRSSYHDLRRASPASSTHHSAVGLSSSPAGSRSPSNSPGQDTPSKENKIGVPTFREENGQRRLVLIVDLGGIFKPQDITVQVIKDNKIWIWAKHEEKTTERLTKSKFSKEYELGEKIETHTLTGTLAPDGKLMVGAYAKGHGGENMATSKSDDDRQSTGGGRRSVDGLKQTQSCVGLVGST